MLLALATLPVAAAATILALQTPPAAATATVERLAAGRFRITVATPPGMDWDAAQLLIAPQAATLCVGDQKPVFGRFEQQRMVMNEPGRSPMDGRFVQEVECETPKSKIAAEPTLPATPDDDIEVRERALRFLQLRAEGARAAIELVEPAALPSLGGANFEKEIASTAKAIGARPIFEIRKVTWYVDPPGVDTGLYGAVDYIGRSDLAETICGYVVLHRGGAKRFGVVRIEQSFLLRDDAKGMTPEARARIEPELRCR